MEPEVNLLSSIEAAKILGVNVSTIKRWTEEGKLQCIKTAGGHRKFQLMHLGEYVKRYKTDFAEVNLFPLENEADLELSFRIMKRDYPYLIHHLFGNALACRHERVQHVLNGLYLANCPLPEIYDRVIAPLLHWFGELWHKNELTVIEEHFGSQTIRDSLIRLQGIIRIPRGKIGSAFCINLSGELHDIALKMVSNLLEVKGYQVYFSGQFTDMMKCEEVFEKFRPARTYVSITWVSDPGKTESELRELSRACKAFESELVVGGQGTRLLNLDPFPEIQHLDSFKALAES